MFSEAKGALLRAVLDGNHVVVPAAHVGRARGLAEAVVGVRGVLEVGRPRGHLEATRRRARSRLATLVRVRVRVRVRVIGSGSEVRDR